MTRNISSKLHIQLNLDERRWRRCKKWGRKRRGEKRGEEEEYLEERAGRSQEIENLLLGIYTANLQKFPSSPDIDVSSVPETT